MTVEPEKLQFECTSDEFRVAVQGCGVRVEIHADGKVTVFSSSEPLMPEDTPLKMTLEQAVDLARNLDEPSRKLSASKQPLEAGHRMSDGTIYVGVSPDTGGPMYTTPNDAPLPMDAPFTMTRAGTFAQAANYAKKLDVSGHRDWRMPTKAELSLLFKHRAAIRGFDTTPAGWYWSSSRKRYGAWAQRFSDGYQCGLGRTIDAALRCVRG